MIKKTYIRIFSLIGIYIVSVNLLHEPITISIKNFICFMIILGTCSCIARLLKRTKLNKYIKMFNIAILAIALLIFIAIESVIIGCPKVSAKDTDYILVLGTGMENSESLTITLRRRLDRVVKSLYKDNNNSYIVLSGSIKNKDNNETDLMEKYLLDKGIKKDKILI